MTHLASRLPQLATSLLALCSAAAAQTALTLPAGIGDDPRSVVAINNGTHLAISNQVDGWLHVINVTNPFVPTLATSYNPPLGDQWFEAEYTPQFGGRLFTGHRGGGINMIDVSNPLSPSAVTIPSIYHFRGMRYRQVGTGGALYYNETNTGLAVFQVNNTGTSLTPMWNDFGPLNQDGNGMEIVGDVLYQMGTPPNATGTRLHRGFDIGNPFLPVMTMNSTLTNQEPAGGHCQLRKQPGTPYVLASRWNDGLQLHDCSAPNNPVIYPIIPANPAIRCWGAAFIQPGLAIAYGSVTIANATAYWWFVLQVLPGPTIVPGPVLMVPMDTHDITYHAPTNRIYAVGRVGGNGQGLLWVF